MDILKQIFSAETPAQTATVEKKEDKMVLETTVTQEKVRPDVVKEGVTYTKEVQCQPQKEIERIREIEIGMQQHLTLNIPHIHYRIPRRTATSTDQSLVFVIFP
jgi:hypothetical protein